MDRRILAPSIGLRLSLPTWIALFVCLELVWTFLGGFFTSFASHLVPEPHGPIAAYLILHVNFIILLVAEVFLIRKVVRVSMVDFLTDSPRFRWKTFWFSAGIWTVGMCLAVALFVAVRPNSIEAYRDQGVTVRLPLVFLAFLFTPLQCLAEEVLFRTMLWRMLQGRMRKKGAVDLIGAVLFAIAHLPNAEVQNADYPLLTICYYLAAGFFFLRMTRVWQGTEAALGVHIANNLFLVLLVNYRGSSLPGIPLWILEEPSVRLDLLVLLACSFVIIRQGRRSCDHTISDG